MSDLLKLFVLLISVLVSILLCFVTALFLKKQNFYIDLQCQFKKNEKLRAAPCPGDSYARNEEGDDCEETPEEQCSEDEDEDERCDDSGNRRQSNPESQRQNHTLSKVPSYCMETGSSSASEPEHDGPRQCFDDYQNVNEKRNRHGPTYSNNRDQRESQPRSGMHAPSQKSRSQSAGNARSDYNQKNPRTPNRRNSKGPPVKAKCVSFHNSPEHRTISTNCECSSTSDEENYRDTKHDKKKVNCIIHIDPEQCNQKGRGGNDRPKSQNDQRNNVHYHKTYNVQSINTERPTTHIHKLDTIEQFQEDSRTDSPRVANSGGHKSAQNNAVKKMDVNYEEYQDAMTADEKQFQKKRRKSEHSEDQINLAAISKHNLEKLREKRKERKRTLLKLQYESGKLQDGIQKFFSGTSNSD